MKNPITNLLARLASARAATTETNTAYPYLLSGHGKAALVQLRPALVANIAAVAEAKELATLLVTESYERSPELASVRSTLESAGWKVEVRTVPATEVRARYGHQTETGQKTERSVQSENTALFDHLLANAVKARADEIHYHVRGKTCGITHLIDGVIYQAESIKAKDGIEVLSNAFTNLADQTSYEHLNNEFAHASRDQSCTIMRTIDGERFKLRYASVPEADGGFDVTMRILPQAAKGQVPSLEKLGFTPSFIRMIRAATERRRGAIYVCGPVGGGKTTLLYALMYRPQDQRDRYVVTVEDPPEYEQYGITRIPVEKIGYEDLEKKLLRMGVHWAMVGEVRDKKMGRMVKVLSATGQKVLTTTHVLSASQIIDRLTGEEIAISRQTLCDTNMAAAFAYTCLVQKLCPHCSLPAATPGALSDRVIEQLDRLEIPLASVRVADKSGCEHCKNGRLGRQPVTELIIPDEEYMRLARAGRDGDAKEYWLNSCKSHVTEEDVTGKPMMATALYWVSQGTMDVADLEREIDTLESYVPRVTRGGVRNLRAA
jgi:type II secretory ATPase GspE/PulE/Tfp pilus assembly ATPase PilB-like protein